MAAKDFNPVDHARPAREEGWKEETDEIIERIENRGDQRIGQLLINAVSQDIEFEDFPEPDEDADAEEVIEKCNQVRNRNKARIEKRLWSIEADELLTLINELEQKSGAE